MNKRSRTEWHALFKQHATSGLSAAAYCRKHGFCPKYFGLKRKQLCSEPSAAASVKPKAQTTLSGFVPARLGPETKEGHCYPVWGGKDKLTEPQECQ